MIGRSLNNYGSIAEDLEHKEQHFWINVTLDMPRYGRISGRFLPPCPNSVWCQIADYPVVHAMALEYLMQPLIASLCSYPPTFGSKWCI